MQTVCKSWNRHKWSWVLAICLLIAVTFTVVMWILNKEFPTNVGFLVIGGLITTITSLVSERIRRPSQARDLARALYMELADRVARCCFDCEAPWHNYERPRKNEFLPLAEIFADPACHLLVHSRASCDIGG